MVDSACQCEETFKCVGNVGFDLLWGHPAIKRGHQNHGDINRRKHVHGHPSNAGQPKNTNEEAYNNEQVRMSDSKRWHKKGSYSVTEGTTILGETISPVLNCPWLPKMTVLLPWSTTKTVPFPAPPV